MSSSGVASTDIINPIHPCRQLVAESALLRKLYFFTHGVDVANTDDARSDTARDDDDDDDDDDNDDDDDER